MFTAGHHLEKHQAEDTGRLSGLCRGMRRRRLVTVGMGFKFTYLVRVTTRYSYSTGYQSHEDHLLCDRLLGAVGLVVGIKRVFLFFELGSSGRFMWPGGSTKRDISSLCFHSSPKPNIIRASWRRKTERRFYSKQASSLSPLTYVSLFLNCGSSLYRVRSGSQVCTPGIQIDF